MKKFWLFWSVIALFSAACTENSATSSIIDDGPGVEGGGVEGGGVEGGGVEGGGDEGGGDEGGGDVNPELPEPEPEPEQPGVQPPEEGGDPDPEPEPEPQDPEPECTPECELGSKACAEDSLKECVKQDDCAVWKETKCGSGMKCNAATLACEKGCADVCKLGDKRCNKDAVETCENVDGCLAWKSSKCAEGTCQASTLTCGYACGDPKSDSCKPFSIVFLPDTQRYTEHKDDHSYYKNQMVWVKNNRSSKNIKMVMHLGDITNFNGEKSKTTGNEWETAVAAHKVLDDANIPYLISTGNHDYRALNSTYTSSFYNGSYTRSLSKFSTYFSAKTKRPNYDKVKDPAVKYKFGGYFYDANTYATMEMGNLKFLLISLEYAARKDVLCKAEELIESHLDHYVLITTHNYLKRPSDGKAGYAGGAYIPIAATGVSGSELATELVKRYSNVIFVGSGHVSGSAFNSRSGNNKNTFYEMLADYQSEQPDGKCGGGANAGNGWVQMLTIDPKGAEQNARVEVVSTLDKAPKFYCKDYYSYNNQIVDSSAKNHKATFNLDLRAAANGKKKIDNYSFSVREMNEKLNGGQAQPAIGMNSSTGDFVAVWMDNSSAADGTYADGKKSNFDIAGRVFCLGGCSKGGQFTVNTTTSGHQSSPDVAMDGKGNFVVVWVDDRKNSGKGDIYMRGFDFSKKEKIAEQKISGSTKGDHRDPAIAMSKNGGFVVVWEDEVTAKSPQIYVAGFNADGSVKFKAQNALGDAVGVRENPDVAMADDGSFVIVWQDDTDNNGSYQLRARAFGADGNALGKAFTVNSVGTRDQKNPSIAMNAAGTYFIAYEDNSNENSAFGIKVRGYAKDGSEVFADTVIPVDYSLNKETKEHTYKAIPHASRPQRYPSIAVDENGNAVVTWFGLVPAYETDSKKNYYYYHTPAVQRAMITKGEDGKYAVSNPSFVTKLKYPAQTADAKDACTPSIDKRCFKNVSSKQPVVASAANGRSVVLWTEKMDLGKVSEIHGRGFEAYKPAKN